MDFKKIISLFTMLCFLTAFAGQNLSWAAAGNEPAAGGFKKIFNDIPVIPAQYGKATNISGAGINDASVNDAGVSDAKTVIVNIQDLHCHPEAQKNINKIIETLVKNYNVKSIFVEGGYGKISTSWLDAIENKDLRDSIADGLLNQGRLTAAEYYAVKNNRSDLLFGLEDEKRHKENITRLGYILENKPKYDAVADRVKREIAYLDIKYAGERNKRFNRLLEKYKSGAVTADKFYSVLYKYVKNINEAPDKYNNILPITMSDYPNIQNYTELIKIGQKLDMKRVYSQLQMLIGVLKERLPYRVYSSFLQATDNLSNADALSITLNALLDEYGLRGAINGYAQLDLFLKTQALRANINPVKMIYEEKDLIEKVRIALSYDQTENEVAFLNDFQSYFADYLNNKLLATDYEYFAARFAKFRELYSKYAPTDALKSIEKDFPILDAYYNLNNERNEIFVNNITKKLGGPEVQQLRNDKDERQKLGSIVSPSPLAGEGGTKSLGEGLPLTPLATLQTPHCSEKELLSSAQNVIIVVAGGYHSLGLQKLLSEKNIPVITYTPNVTSNVASAEKTYDEVIREQSTFLKEALAFTIASQATTREQFLLMAQAGVKILEKEGYSEANILELVKAMLPA
ncbi:MAG: hypothetical protein FWC57_06710, partial [Endomicrobia bacterium]|nr:hypothetical protein [Endomicrobiia bacterium]